MRYLLTIILLGSFLGVTVFGFVGMEHTMLEGGCITMVLHASPSCVGTGNVFAFANFHIGALKAFSTAIIVATLFSLFFLVYYFWTSFFYLRYSFLQRERYVLTPAGRSSPSFKKVMRWIKIHEKSPEKY